MLRRRHSGRGAGGGAEEPARGAKVFLPRSDRGKSDLPRALKRHSRSHGSDRYRTLRANRCGAKNLGQIAQGTADAVSIFQPIGRPTFR